MANSVTVKNTVNKTGDTIYGNLITRTGNHYIVSYTIDSSSTSNTNIWDNGYFLNDKNNVSLGYFRSVSIANNGCGVQVQGERIINGNRTENNLRLLVDDNGNAKVNINQPAAWRAALGVISKTGDDLSGNLNFNNSDVKITQTAYNTSTATEGNIWGRGIYFYDSSNENRIKIRDCKVGTSEQGLQIEVSRNGQNNTLRLGILQDGTPKVVLAQDAWRIGLGLGSVATESIVPISKGGTGTSTSTAALQALGAVSKSGDTINGTILASGCNFSIKDTDIQENVTPSSNIYGKGIWYYDANGNNLGGVRINALTNGYKYLSIYTDRYNTTKGRVTNSLGFQIDQNGNCKIDISHPAAWQDTLGIDNIIKYIRGKRIAIFGDSISDEDIQWSSAVNNVWVKTFRTLAAKYQVGTITNYSRSSRGFCVKDNNNQYTTEEIINNTNFSNIDTVIIFCGVNDFLGGTLFGQEGVSTNGTLWKALNTIKNKIIGKQVFIITPLQTANTSNNTLKGYTLEMYRICLANWAAKNNFMLINGSAIPQFHKASGLYNDGLHPSNNYTYLIAEYILSKMLIGGEPFKECPESAEYTIAKTTNTSQATTIRFTASQNFTTMYCKISADAAIPSGEIKNGSNELGPKFDNWFYIPYTNGNYAQYAGTSIATSSSGYYEFEVSYPTKALGQR